MRQFFLTICVGLALMVAGSPACALEIKTHKLGNKARGLHGTLLKPTIRTFGAESEAQSIFEQIIAGQGLSSSRIQIRSSGDVANAAAFIDETGSRVIAYNVVFMEEVKNRTGRYWSLISIMAHEVGHHLNFHTYEATATPDQSQRDELDADYFSGHALARLGATLDEAISAIKTISPEQATATHPGRSDRIQVIALGWKAGVKLRPGEPEPKAPEPAAPDPVPPIAEMRIPIDNLFAAWRNLDAEQYARQWAPGATKHDLKAGTRKSAERVALDRRKLFRRLASARASHTLKFAGLRDGKAYFSNSYNLAIRYRSGKQFSERACESYTVRKIGGRWLIDENWDYVRCQ